MASSFNVNLMDDHLQSGANMNYGACEKKIKEYSSKTISAASRDERIHPPVTKVVVG